MALAVPAEFTKQMGCAGNPAQRWVAMLADFCGELASALVEPAAMYSRQEPAMPRPTSSIQSMVRRNSQPAETVMLLSAESGRAASTDDISSVCMGPSRAGDDLHPAAAIASKTTASTRRNPVNCGENESAVALAQRLQVHN
jgi:hypothetical protein